MSAERTNEDEAPPTEATKREGPGSPLPEPKSARPPVRLERGDLVGRYMILDVLGAGGMGVVYSAFDPELDRKVAIKLLQADKGGDTLSGGGNMWLLREAQALARLAHPNVIAVHDVGTIADEQVFIAMELVDGITLRDWLKEQTRSWRDVLPILRAAGAGLAAAHTAGLVHRDFKPDNVLVGKDGRVRVMDFGLARLRPGDEVSDRASDAKIEQRSPLAYDLTTAGTVLGTPAYMAPEINDGLGAGPRSDQFAFGVALFEALYHERPFEKRALVAPRPDGLAPKTPRASDVPAAFHRVALRALSIDPNARYASMDELLAELAIEPFAGRRRALVAGGLIAVAGAGVLALVALSQSSERACSGAERRLAGVWDAPTKDAVHKAFLATQGPTALQSFAVLSRGLDGYAGELTGAVVESCEATRAGTQTDAIHALRQSCLDQRLEGLRALTRGLANSAGDLVDQSDTLVGALEPIDRCANLAMLREPNAPAPENKARYDELAKQLAYAKIQALVGDTKGALAAAEAGLDGARKIHAEDLAAAALFVRGAAQTQSGSMTDGLDSLAEAAWSGTRGRRDDVVAQAAVSSALAIAQSSGNPDLAQFWLRLGTAAGMRVGIDHQLELHELTAEGMVAASRGDLVAAVAAHQKALAAAELVFGHDSPALWVHEDTLGATMSKAADYVAAIPHVEHALALREATVGEDHPDVARLLSNLGALYDHAGDSTRAIDAFQRALGTREKKFGANSPMLVATLNNLADFKAHHGDIPGGIADIARAKVIAHKLPGTAHPLYHIVATTEAEILDAAGRYPESRAAFETVIALEEDAKSSEEPETLASRGQLELDDHKYADAIAFSTRAIAGFEAAGGKDALGLWRPLANLATAKRAADPTADVVALYERAIAIATKAQVKASDLDPVKAELAALAR